MSPWKRSSRSCWYVFMRLLSGRCSDSDQLHRACLPGRQDRGHRHLIAVLLLLAEPRGPLQMSVPIWVQAHDSSQATPLVPWESPDFSPAVGLQGLHSWPCSTSRSFEGLFLWCSSRPPVSSQSCLQQPPSPGRAPAITEDLIPWLAVLSSPGVAQTITRWPCSL